MLPGPGDGGLTYISSSLKCFKYVAKSSDLDNIINGVLSVAAKVGLHGAKQSRPGVRGV